MNSLLRQYLFGGIFLAVAAFEYTRGDYLEMSFYCIAGAAFIINGLSLEPRLVAYKKVLVIIAWVLIISTAVMFLYVIQKKFL